MIYRSVKGRIDTKQRILMIIAVPAMCMSMIGF